MLDWQTINTWKILVVEDDPDNRAVISEVLEFYGMTVQTAENGVAGLEVLENFVPTLILLDLSMPKMDGWEMRAQVKSKQALEGVPIVALTAHAMLDDKRRVLAAGFDGYLKKPITVMTLIADLRATLERESAAESGLAVAENKRCPINNTT
jgi:CheY-like chemotaxis protein